MPYHDAAVTALYAVNRTQSDYCDEQLQAHGSFLLVTCSLRLLLMLVTAAFSFPEGGCLVAVITSLDI